MAGNKDFSPAFADDQWTLVERHFEKEHNRIWETLCSVGNGYLGMRGSFEEGLDGYSTGGTFINGYYENSPYRYPEGFPGYAENNQTILNLADTRAIRLVFDDGEVYQGLAANKAIVSDYSRRLELQTGLLTRELTWQSPTGKKIHLKFERLVSFDLPHVAAVRLTITPQSDCGAHLTIASLIDYQIRRETSHQHDPRNAAALENELVIEGQEVFPEGGALLFQRTHHSQITAACGLRDRLPNHPETSKVPVDDRQEAVIGTYYTVPLKIDQPIILEKYMVYCTSLDVRPDNLRHKVLDELRAAYTSGFAELCTAQSRILRTFWDHANITLDGDDWTQGAIRFNMFHLLQSAGRNGQTGIPAKGLTSQGYDGHYFWDTESYMLPFFLHTDPQIARKLLEYRFNTLDHARRRARDLSHPKGALFAWRTINGEECSANYPTGTAQYHINADIAFAVKRYFDVTGDKVFMLDYGAEILFETARLWFDLGDFIPTRGNRFCLHSITGPDEYTTLVDNNTYTNLMARENLMFAAQIARWMQTEHLERYEQIKNKKEVALEAHEPADWQEAADKMYIPEPVNVGSEDAPHPVLPQDDLFLYKPLWNRAADNIPLPLLLKHHPLVYNRYQVCKQADLILAEFMLGHLPIFSREQKERDFNYYEAVTTHDSSLSRCIFSIAAAQLADPADPNDPYLNKALAFYRASATIDLDNHRNETRNGIHAANMGGSWMGIVFGFAQMRTHDGLSFCPLLPPGWTAYAFQVYYQERRVQVQIGPGRDSSGYPICTFTLTENKPNQPPLVIRVCEKTIQLAVLNESVTIRR
ncbi:MAG: glycoside hydrolase family 65 protein [Chloroflexi bacterium]|nr:glycoside hydrolase family 65 protein [Chloroflexota bacterium]